jgi:D-glycero-alpha-D-manno-heptose-7-phosphate kinase
MAAYGGLNHVRFLPTGEITVRPVILRPERIAELNSHLMLFYTGIKRTAADVADSYVSDLESRRRQLRIMQDLVDEGLTVLTGSREIAAFGELLHEGWMTKRSYSGSVSNTAVDEIYATAREAGAIGGKLLGAGGGGFVMLFAPPDCHAAIRQILQRLIYVPFKFESNGSQIIYYDQETDYSREDDVRLNSNSRPIFRELKLTSES